MSEYYPDKWMIIRIEGTDPHFRVFGSWSGGYLDGDSWRLNSGIESVVEDGNYYNFIGHSGSVYRCHKEMYGANVYGYGAAQDLCKDGNAYLLQEQPENVLDMDTWIN